MSIRLAIVVPCYNEEEVPPETSRSLIGLLNRLQLNRRLMRRLDQQFPIRLRRCYIYG